MTVESPAVPGGTECYRKVLMRIMPPCIIMYFIQYLERTNISLAAMEMNGDIGLNDTTYNVGYSLLYVGYISFALPSSMMYNRFKVKWLTVMMIASGVAACAMSIVPNAWGFFAVRFVIGMAEAGFLPSMWLYIATWFPEDRLSAVYAIFSAAVPISSIVSGPLASAFLSIRNSTFRGWQLLYVAEGTPGILMGIAVLFWLPNEPRDARWLTEDEKRWVEATRKPTDDNSKKKQLSFRQKIRQLKKVGAGWGYILAWAACASGFYTWLANFPLMMRHVSGWEPWLVGLIMIGPASADVLGRVIFGWLTTRLQEYFWHGVVSVVMAIVLTVSCYLFVLADIDALVMVSNSVAMLMIGGLIPTFLAFITRALPPDVTSLGLTALNVGTSLGGAVGPMLAGVITDGSFVEISIFVIVSYGLFVAGSLLTRYIYRNVQAYDDSAEEEEKLPLIFEDNGPASRRGSLAGPVSRRSSLA
eukprot:TRINITY_DN9083_c0_g3_i1.p1 TRINITY_DN9083_c0_g3~~TRINITY_DN9083_c0_g3_i1.p1  ORF type:complete len:473 (-),score=130.84 TRINITY_DN9083_c0_g3_i1:625-2043(-)